MKLLLDLELGGITLDKKSFGMHASSSIGVNSKKEIGRRTDTRGGFEVCLIEQIVGNK